MKDKYEQDCPWCHFMVATLVQEKKGKYLLYCCCRCRTIFHIFPSLLLSHPLYIYEERKGDIPSDD